MIEEELKLVFIYFLTGILIAFIFDFFRSTRKVIKTGDRLTNIEDIIFWVITFFILIIVMFRFNNFVIRYYLIFACILGIIFYILLISKYIIKIDVKIMSFTKKIVKKVCIFIKSLL